MEGVAAANEMTSKEHKLFFAQKTVGTKGGSGPLLVWP